MTKQEFMWVTNRTAELEKLGYDSFRAYKLALKEYEEKHTPDYQEDDDYNEDS